MVAKYCQAADCYVHLSKADTFPNAVIEALACGIPVVASSIGGMPEQIRGLAGGSNGSEHRHKGAQTHGKDEATGILVPGSDPDAVAASVIELISNSELAACLGRNAARDACRRFDMARQAADFLEWYEQILARRNGSGTGPGGDGGKGQ